ncbi:MAG: DUF2075 domain-containing protein [Sulfuricurvum sp.]|nr:DUF2075 domain-containing protein [Sulfuricurvum sp.]
MKNINLLSLVQSYDTLEEVNYKNFLEHYGITIKDKEVDDLNSLVTILYDGTAERSIFSQFYVSYKIPQIGKEFDLLRFGDSCVINIELKNSSTEEKIFNQLKRNGYYLSFIEKQIYAFTFVADEKKLYFLNDEDKIIEVDFSYLIKFLLDQQVAYLDNVDKIFDPSDYLVSPFNSTEKFIQNEYFLTHQQEELKTNILTIIKDFSKANFISITGSAGTGKTLLTYDIAKEIKKSGKNVLIIHCGYLNEGQMKLTQEHAWAITAIKHYSGYNFSHYALVIIDEAQRIYANQLVAIVQQIQSMNGNCLFSYDNAQTLSLQEEGNNIAQKISEIPSIVSYELSEKIRTNKEIASFIKMLFDKNKNSTLSNENNIELNYFSNNDDAKEFLSVLDDQGWEVIRFTPSQYNQEHHEQYALYTADTSHKVIGQEYDKVAVTIDRHFFYNDKGKLMYRGSAYYHPVKMLFQNITRTRKKLHIVIINNSELLERCLNILNK